MIAGLLFLAFAFFAVAQAGTVRNGGQTAADAAALGAAEDDRQQLFDGFLDALGDEEGRQEWLDAVAPLSGDGCGAAAHFADRNRSDLLSCDPVSREGDDGYRVSIETRFDTGDTIIPGTDNKTAKATATAVIRPRCEADGTEKTTNAAEEIELVCGGEELTIDPEDEGRDLKPSDLFSVVLVE
ncbi:hypothetical protein KBY19_06175 [Streptomyces sp. B15]|nr:hypothetical protein [Streptomyces sp. B15]